MQHAQKIDGQLPNLWSSLLYIINIGSVVGSNVMQNSVSALKKYFFDRFWSLLMKI